MEILKAKRQVTKGSITRIYNFCTNHSATLDDVKVRVGKLEELFSRYESIQDEIDALITTAEQRAIEDSYRQDIETHYFAIKSSYSSLLREENADRTIVGQESPDNISQAIQAMADSQTSISSILERLTTERLHQSTPVVNSNVGQCETRLPQIQIPEFDGAYTEWLRFRDLFEALIHNRSTLSNVEKLEYLQTRLKGEALSLIKHLKPSNDNYEIAWTMLNDKYDKSEHIKRSYMELLFDQAPIKSSCIAEIKRFYNNSNESLNALKGLDQSVKYWDSILLFLLEKKLDHETHILWCRERRQIKDVKFQRFLKFLEERISELESIQRCVPRPPVKPHAMTNQRSQPNAYSATVQNCICCSGNHLLYQCDEFRRLSVQDRYQLARRNGLCFNCLRLNHYAASCKASSCRACNERHNTLLHFASGDMNNQLDFAQDLQLQAAHQSFTVNTSNRVSGSTTILPTLFVMVRDKSDQLQPCRALLDSGAQATLISESCLQRLGLKRQYDKTLMMGVGLNPGNYTKGIVNIEFVSEQHKRSLFSRAYCLSKLTQNLPSSDVDCDKFDFFKNIKLADTQFNKSAKIDIIMGADLFGECVLPEKIVHPSGSPTAVNSIFGWVIMGRVDMKRESGIFAAHVALDLDGQLRKFWELEELSQPNVILSEEEIEAETHFRNNFRRVANGRYMVKLPFRKTNAVLGESKIPAYKRFMSLERKFEVNGNLRDDYSRFMEEYLALNHMEIDTLSQSVHGYFLPHHAVLKPTSSTTKLRVVFDASCQTSNGISLNDQLLTGPTIQNDLLTIILNFRKYEIGISADIEKMYRQVLIHPDDRCFQRILWRKSKDEPITEYHLNTITYGTSAAPFLATRTLHQIAIDNSTEYPEASQAIDEHFYVDDFMYCSKDVNSALQVKDTLCSILLQSGFNLRKWSSNSPDVIEGIDVADRDLSANTTVDSSQTVKTLGLFWDTQSDNFKYSSVLQTLPHVVTKRMVLSDIAKIFDPVGWLAPMVVALKVFMQKLWLQGIEWDQQLPDNLYRQWKTLRDGIGDVSRIKIPRWLRLEDNVKVEIHGFADSSELAYAAVVYLKVVRGDGKLFTNLVTAKTRVAPVRQVSLPRLELCAAHLLAKLLVKMKSSMNLQDCEVIAWSDSTVVLSWLSDHPRRWKSFVANRTSYILERIPSQSWRHITSQSNPADLATRGIPLSNLLGSQLWWHGPEEMRCLTTTPKNYPPVIDNTDMEERIGQVFHLTVEKDQSIIDRYSNYTKLVYITALLLRFIRNCGANRQDRTTGVLTTFELQEAEWRLVRIAQQESYATESRILTSGRQLATGNKLSQLNPFMDDNGLIRVGGRIENSSIPYNQKHPLILHKEHTLSRLIIHHYHLKYLHAGNRQMTYLIGLKYWIPSISCIVKRCVYQCTTCMRFRGIAFKQQMGNLPAHRLQPTFPFINTGVDFAGPVYVRSWRGRGSRLYKAWIAVFVCLATKALHLELVSELSTAAFLASLRRFVSRRGKPLHIYSDNGTNFVGCNQYIRELYQHLQNAETQHDIQKAMAEQHVQWHFSPPSAPHFGGIWEAGVKSTKYHIKRILKDAHVTFEEMSTILCQIESCLNSRPLCIKFEGDVDPLTPAHFLIMRSMVAVPDEDLKDARPNYCTRWKYLQKLVQQFWNKWSNGYLTQLQQRPKWYQKVENVKVDDVVIIKDDNLPPTQWSIAKIIETHPGSDGLIRVVTVKTSRGVYKRPISKLCPLFVDN